MAKTFTVMHSPILKAVPWHIVEPHRAQAMTNHQQTLERLDERGGLDVTELASVLLNERYKIRGPEEATQIVAARIAHVAWE